MTRIEGRDVFGDAWEASDDPTSFTGGILRVRTSRGDMTSTALLDATSALRLGAFLLARGVGLSEERFAELASVLVAAVRELESARANVRATGEDAMPQQWLQRIFRRKHAAEESVIDAAVALVKAAKTEELEIAPTQREQDRHGFGDLAGRSNKSRGNALDRVKASFENASPGWQALYERAHERDTAVVKPICLCPATSEYDPPCPRCGVRPIGQRGDGSMVPG